MFKGVRASRPLRALGARGLRVFGPLGFFGGLGVWGLVFEIEV